MKRDEPPFDPDEDETDRLNALADRLEGNGPPFISRRVRRWRVRPLIAWYDLWIGVYVDRANRSVYVLPLPCIGVVIERVR
jgi:hypothetical protein